MLDIRHAKKALETLQALGLLGRDESGRLIVAENTINTSSDVASEAIRRYHEQMLDNAKDAIRSVAVDAREITGASLAMKAADVPRAKEMIREFRTRFARTFESAEGDSVHQIQIQLFPLTKEGALQ